MRLLQTSTLQLEEFLPSEIPPYAILSHRWGKSTDEVSYADVVAGRAQDKVAYAKVKACCRQANRDKLEYVWIDACCIDKSSSAELSEAINSMFAWYQDSKVCYAYLADVPPTDDVSKDSFAFVGSDWFTRGWTLQELLAPKNVVFYSKGWHELGDKMSLSKPISHATKIDASYLCGKKRLGAACVAQRMYWASGRKTSRPEDMAYCLLGIFSISLDLRYGEGVGAFRRLQEEIMKNSNDHSLFAWIDPTANERLEHGLLADSPGQFASSRDVSQHMSFMTSDHTPYSMTNKGLMIDLELVRTPSKDEVWGVLDCTHDPRATLACIAVRLKGAYGESVGSWRTLTEALKSQRPLEFRRAAIHKWHTIRAQWNLRKSVLVSQSQPSLPMEVDEMGLMKW